MGKTAYQRANEILRSLRDCTLKAFLISPAAISEEDTLDGEIKALGEELSKICNLANVPFFSYTYDVPSYERQKDSSKKYKECVKLWDVPQARYAYLIIEDSLRAEVEEV